MENSQSKLFDRTVRLIERSLNVRTLRHKVLSANIANAGSPDHVSNEVDFQTVLQASMENPFQVSLGKTHPAHLEQGFESAVQAEVAQDGEAFDLDRELAKLAENNLMFLAGVQALIKKFEALKVTIVEGGR
jgi:flagellar basal-body rod protein FlgB